MDGGHLDESTIARLLRTTPILLVLGLVLLLVRLSAGALQNDDTYFHLRFGSEFLDGWSARNPGSVTSAGTADWLPTQWLSQIGMGSVEDALGLPGVAFLSGLLFSTLVLTLYAVARQVANPGPSAVAVFLATVASSLSLSMRPQVFSFILVALIWWVWHRARTRAQIPWIVVPITWVWAMLHGMWPLGLIISLVAAVAIRLDGGTWQTFGRHVAVIVTAGVAAAFTPVGPGLYSAVVEVNGRGQYFDEWGPPEFLTPYGIAVVSMLGIVILVQARKPGSLDWFDVATLALAGAFAVYSMRTVAVAAVLATPLVAGSLQRLIGDRTPRMKTEWPMLGLGTAACLVLLAVTVPNAAALTPDQPDWLDDEMAALPAETRILNEQTRGGYLMWRYPDLDFVMNGYGDIYTTPELERMVDMIRVRPGWNESVRSTGAEIALVDPESALGYALRLCDWTALQTAKDLELLRAPERWSQNDACATGPTNK